MSAQPNSSGAPRPNSEPTATAASRTPTLEELVLENRAATLDIQHRIKRIERLQLAKLVVTLVFIVAPLIGALIILPRAIGSLMTGYGVQGVDGKTGIMELWGQVDELQGTLDSINAQTQ